MLNEGQVLNQDKKDNSEDRTEEYFQENIIKNIKNLSSVSKELQSNLNSKNKRIKQLGQDIEHKKLILIGVR